MKPEEVFKAKTVQELITEVKREKVIKMISKLSEELFEELQQSVCENINKTRLDEVKNIIYKTFGPFIGKFGWDDLYDDWNIHKVYIEMLFWTNLETKYSQN